MAAAIDASVLVSVGVKDAGDGDSHCHDIQQILFVVGQKGFSGVRKMIYFQQRLPSHAENIFFRGKENPLKVQMCRLSAVELLFEIANIRNVILLN